MITENGDETMGKGNKKGPGADGTEEENGTKKSDEEKTDETGEEEANDQDGDGEVRDSSGQIIDVDDDINDLQLAPGRRSKPSFSERRAAKRIQKAITKAWETYNAQILSNSWGGDYNDFITCGGKHRGQYRQAQGQAGSFL